VSQPEILRALLIIYFVVFALSITGTWLLFRRRSAVFRWRWKAWVALLNNVVVGVFLVAFAGLWSRSWIITVSGAVFMALVTYYHVAQTRVCHRCGMPSSPGSSHCRRCGTQLWASPFFSVLNAPEPPISGGEGVAGPNESESPNKQLDQRWRSG